MCGGSPQNVIYHAQRPDLYQSDAGRAVQCASHLLTIDKQYFSRSDRKRFIGLPRRNSHVGPLQGEMLPMLDRTFCQLINAVLTCKPGSSKCFLNRFRTWKTLSRTGKSPRFRANLIEFATGPFLKQAKRWLHSSTCGTSISGLYPVSQSRLSTSTRRC